MLEYYISLQPSAQGTATGQSLITTRGTTEFIVPSGVRELSAVAIGCGITFSDERSAGGLSWRNNIPVTPGERLTITLGVEYIGQSYVYHDTSLSRGSVVLITAQTGMNGGKGGKDANPINDGGGNGGTSGLDTNYGSGGGAGGYSGNGGNGGYRYGAGSDGQGGGGAGGGKSDGRIGSFPGGGVGCYGEGESGLGQTNGRGNSGSVLSPEVYGAGGQAYNFSGASREAGPGCLYLIWGEGRFFPNTNVAPIET